MLSGCTAFKAPKTLFIAIGAPKETFVDDTREIRLFLDTYTEAFQRSNPDTKIVYLSYPYKQFLKEIEADSSLNLGPDLFIPNQITAPILLERNLTATVPQQQYFDKIYSPRIKSKAKANKNYTYIPWLIDTQVACFNKTKIAESPTTVEDLEVLSADGKKIGLASTPFELSWTAGTQGAISEFSSLGTTTKREQAYPAIQKWLQWLRRVASYQNISFHKDARELSTKLKQNELDWITCFGSQIKELRSTMGHNLGIAALPNGEVSKASPRYAIWGFALGKDSSKMQREMAMKLIKASVNDIAQRKIELDDRGLLAANKNVSVPSQSSKTLAALNTSFYEQSKTYQDEQNGLRLYSQKFPPLYKTLKDLINGYLNVEEALKIITTPQTE